MAGVSKLMYEHIDMHDFVMLFDQRPRLYMGEEQHEFIQIARLHLDPNRRIANATVSGIVDLQAAR